MQQAIFRLIRVENRQFPISKRLLCWSNGGVIKGQSNEVDRQMRNIINSDSYRGSNDCK